MDADFEELSNDTNLIARVKQFYDAAMRIEDTIKMATDPEIYEKLSNEDKIQYDLLMSYCLNSTFWMYLRAEGRMYFILILIIYLFFIYISYLFN